MGTRSASFAPQRGEAWANGKVVLQSGRRCIRFLHLLILPRLTGRDITDYGLTARLHCDPTSTVILK
jgi:hypothetical protein